jgi:hypothetical protein
MSFEQQQGISTCVTDLCQCATVVLKIGAGRLSRQSAPWWQAGKTTVSGALARYGMELAVDAAMALAFMADLDAEAIIQPCPTYN